MFNLAEVAAIGLSIQGLTANNKIYDATMVAPVSGTPLLSGVTNGDDVSLIGTPVYAFDSKNVGTGINITTTGWTLSGANAANYTLTQPTLSANITSTLGLEVPTLKALVTMYPNPVKDQLTIKSNKHIEQIGLFNVLGQELKKLNRS